MKVESVNSEDTYKSLIMKHFEEYSVSAGLSRINEFREKLHYIHDLEVEDLEDLAGFKKSWSQAVDDDLSHLADDKFWRLFQGFISQKINRYSDIVEKDLTLADDLFAKHIHGMVSGEWDKAISVAKERIKLGKELAQRFDADLNFMEFVADCLDI